MIGHPRRIAVALYGAIGDVILSTPLLESLGTACPDARLTYIVGSTAAPALRHLPWVHETIVVPDAHGPDRRADFRLLQQIGRGHFDWALCLSRSVKLALAFWIARVPVRVGYIPIPASWMFTHLLDAYAHSAAHRTGFFLAAAQAVGVSPVPRVRLHYQVTEAEWQEAFELLQALGADPANEILVAIHPGTSRVHIEKRRWSLSNFAAVAQHVVRQPNRKVLLLGGPDEQELARDFPLPLGDRILDLTGRLSFRQMAAVLRHCRVLVHNDSSPLHLAGAVGTPVLAIFGYQNAALWGPLGARDRVVRMDLDCSPCLPEFQCPRSFECLGSLPTERVIGVLEAMLAQPEPAGSRS